MIRKDNNPKGIILVLFGMAFFSVQDALIKYVHQDTSLYELYLLRTLVAAMLLLIFLLITKKKNNIKNTLSNINSFKSNIIFFRF